MDIRIIAGLLISGVGAYLFHTAKSGALKDAKSAKVQIALKLLGEKGVAILYSIMGIVMMLGGIVFIISLFIK